MDAQTASAFIGAVWALVGALSGLAMALGLSSRNR